MQKNLQKDKKNYSKFFFSNLSYEVFSTWFYDSNLRKYLFQARKN